MLTQFFLTINERKISMSQEKEKNEQPTSLKNLIFAILINGGIVAFEMVFGLLIRSMALISDAVHNLSDIATCSSAHIKSGEESPDHEAIIRAVQEMLLHKYGINHTTLQILPFSAGEMAHCSHCN